MKLKRRTLPTFVVLAAALSPLGVLALAGTEAAPPPARFREVAFEKGPRITDRLAEDVDGDGRPDLVIVRGREFAIHLQKDGTYDPDRPDQKFRLDERAIIWDFGDLDGDGRPELIFLATDGMWYYAWSARTKGYLFRRVPLLPAASLLKTASKEEVRQKDFFADFDGDGAEDVLVPAWDRFLLYRGGREDGQWYFNEAIGLEVAPVASIGTGGGSPTSQATMSFWFPQPFSGDWNGDGKADIFLFQQDRLAVFIHKGGEAGAAYDLKPTSVLPIDFKEPLEEGRFKLDLRLPVKFADVDGDGLTDIVATHIGRGTTYVFRGGRGRTGLTPEAARGDTVIRVPGVSFLDFLIDLNGDGRKDLILGRADRPGILDILKILLTKDVDVEVLFFYGLAGDRPGVGLFNESPSHRKAIKVPILFSSSSRGVNIGTSAVVTVEGDWNGDGRNDLMLRGDERSLSVYAGIPGGFSDSPTLTMAVTAMDGYRFLEPLPQDLNGDGISDLILTYFSWDAKGDRLSVLLSQK